MLGRNLSDPHHVESNHAQVSGIGLLDVETEFLPEKRTTRSRGYLQSLWPGREVEGYELHLGKTSRRQTAPFLLLDSGEYDGALTEDGRVLGTYLHGLFQNRSFTRDFLNHLRLQKGRPPVIGKVAGEKQRREESYRKLAEHLRKAIDIDRVKAIIQSSNAYLGNRSSVPNS
jgi:adenosylcobyric acid synthase